MTYTNGQHDKALKDAVTALGDALKRIDRLEKERIDTKALEEDHARLMHERAVTMKEREGLHEWEVKGRLAWSALTETAPEDATAQGLLDEARMCEEAVSGHGSDERVSACIQAICARMEEAEIKAAANESHKIGFLSEKQRADKAEASAAHYQRREDEYVDAHEAADRAVRITASLRDALVAFRSDPTVVGVRETVAEALASANRYLDREKQWNDNRVQARTEAGERRAADYKALWDANVESKRQRDVALVALQEIKSYLGHAGQDAQHEFIVGVIDRARKAQ